MTAAQAILSGEQSYENLSVFSDADRETLYFSMNVRPRPCFTWDLLRDFLTFQKRLVETLRLDTFRPRCLVYASETPRVFSLGGDLSLFKLAIETKDRAMLMRYAEDCVNALYNHITTPELVTVSLLEGDALGAGLETALGSDVIIAERGIRAGFPEVLFNLIPGHGAFHLVARRVGPQMAENMIRSGTVYTAEELHALGLFDIVVERGEGRRAVRELIVSQKKSWNAYRALQHVKRRYCPVTREMLQANAEIWVDAAMNLTDRDLRMMERLVRAQDKRAGIVETGRAEALLQQTAA